MSIFYPCDISHGRIEPVGERCGKRGRTIYLVDSATKSELFESLLTEPDDYCFGRPGAVSGASIRGGSVTVQRADCWGLDRADGIYELCDTLQAAGLPTRPSASSMAGHLWDKCYPDSRATHPRWREMCHDAVYCAPIMHLRGGCQNGALMDIRSAFLAAVRDCIAPDGDFAIVRRIPRAGPGLFYGELEFVANGIIPMVPSQLPDGRVGYLSGRFRGVWPLDIVRRAIDAGYSAIPRLIVASGRLDTAPITARLEALPGAVKKAVYTRLWGRLCSKGGWRGYRRRRADSHPMHRLWWVDNRLSLLDSTAGYYRPDVAAAICSANLLRVWQYVGGLHRESVVFAHVDSVCVDTDIQHVNDDDTWRAKHHGTVRAYGPGRYSIGTHVAASGWTGELPPTVATMDTWASREPYQQAPTRVWSGDPRVDATATSEPCEWAGEWPRQWRGPDPGDTATWRAPDWRDRVRWADRASNVSTEETEKRRVSENPLVD